MLEYTPQLLVSAVTEGSVYALMGLGLSIIYRSTEVMFFAQGTLAMIAGVTLYGFTQWHVPLYAAVPMCLMVCVIVALAAQYAVIMPLLDRGVPPLSVSMITIGIAFIYETLAMILFGKEALPVPLFSGDTPFHILGASIAPQEFWIIGSTIVALSLSLLFFKRSWTGKALTGLGDNPLLAKASGLPVRLLISYAFIFAALVGGLAGAVSAPISYAGYWLGTRWTIKGFVAAAVGGMSNPLGVFLGGLIIGFFEALTAGFISSMLRDLITMALLLLVLRLRPQGLMGDK